MVKRKRCFSQAWNDERQNFRQESSIQRRTWPEFTKRCFWFPSRNTKDSLNWWFSRENRLVLEIFSSIVYIQSKCQLMSLVNKPSGEEFEMEKSKDEIFSSAKSSSKGADNCWWEGLNLLSFHHFVRIPHVIRLFTTFSFMKTNERNRMKTFFFSSSFPKTKDGFMEMKRVFSKCSDIYDCDRNFTLLFNNSHCNLVSSSSVLPAYSLVICLFS